jgi:hypothetical protein
MTRRLTPPEHWWADAADLIARCEISLRQAAAELGIDLSIEEADNIKGPTDALLKLAKIRGWVGKKHLLRCVRTLTHVPPGRVVGRGGRAAVGKPAPNNRE